MTDIENAIDAALAVQMERQALKQAAARLSEDKVGIKNLRHLPLPDDVMVDLASLVNRIEDSMWRVEQRIMAIDKANR